MGSRIMTFSALSAIREESDAALYSAVERAALMTITQNGVLRRTQDLLGVAARDLCATCAYAVIGKNGGYAHLRGDGVIAVGEVDGTLMLIRYDWDGNMPFYPAYVGPEFDAFVKNHGGPESERLREEQWVRSPASPDFIKTTERMWSVEKGMAGMVHEFSPEFISQRLLFVALFTDGIMQIDQVDWKDAAVELLAFKTTAGAFAKRRLNAALKKFREFGKGPEDDIALAVVYVSREGEGEANDQQ